MCGEQIPSAAAFSAYLGSPPRVRGTVASVIAMAGDERITPACAGNRSHPASCSDLPWDHPRVCGEQIACLGSFARIAGSPPRVRGTE